LIKIEIVHQESKSSKLFNQPIKENVVKGDSDELVNFKVGDWNENI